MKKLLFTLVLCVVAIAKRGVWKTLKLADGTEVRAQLVGDENGHFWKTADGTAYILNDNVYEAVDARKVIDRAKVRRNKLNAERMKRLPGRNEDNNFLGKKKGIILLVNFNDTQFKTEHDNALYQRVANEIGFSEGRFKGSMRDYFMAQSNELFELDFDIVGPLTVSKNYSYYGGNDNNGNDKYPGKMVIEAVKLAKDLVTDWTVYDWNDDGYVDQVYVIYAGQGEADTDVEDYIWPHAYTLSDAKEDGDGTGPVTVSEGLMVDTYACGSELNYANEIDGIGTICHEFSHCLGYPDFYDIDYSGGQGMSSWDLMDQGSYNGDGYCPAGYTGYERWVAGWLEPVVLEDKDSSIENMKALQDGGETYIIYNKGNRNEYYMLDNRQLIGWDESLPSAGLLIIHVDYDDEVWYNNQPNDDPKHQRFTWIPADNKYDYKYYMGTKYYTDEGLITDPFPYKNNKTFNKNSKPAATLYNKNADGTKYLDSSIENITQNADGTISFQFVANYNGTDPDKPSVEGALFYESFDQCEGKGGNDGLWSGQIANSSFTPDNDGWGADKAYGADQCAKFGTSSIAGEATTPAFLANGEMKLTFKAGAWNAKNDGTTLNISVSGGTAEPQEVTLTKGEFNDYEVTITAQGQTTVTFAMSQGRFFLDEVLVKDLTVTGIQTTPTTSSFIGTKRIYTLDGRYVGTDMNTLSRGIYIVDGKKVVK